MTFYQLLQLDPLILKQKIKSTKSPTNARFLKMRIGKTGLGGFSSCIKNKTSKIMPATTKLITIQLLVKPRSWIPNKSKVKPTIIRKEPNTSNFGVSLIVPSR